MSRSSMLSGIAPILLVAAVTTLESPAPLIAQECRIWRQVPVTGPSARTHHAMAFDRVRNVTVLFGGYNQIDPYLGDTWEFDGIAWTLRSTEGPSPRRSAMAFDSARGVTVLFGGYNYSERDLGDTWEWDGTAWSLRSTTGPSPRGGHAMVYDSARGVTVLFGGYNQTDRYRGDTWEWDGTSWTLRSASGPRARDAHAMAYDEGRVRTVLFGGNFGGLGPIGDTWEWDGTAWLERSPSGPSERLAHAMAYHTSASAVVMFGGAVSGPIDVPVPVAYTHEWDGTRWWFRWGTGPPEGATAIAFDASRDVTVLFGGGGYPLHDQTWEYGTVEGGPDCNGNGTIDICDMFYCSHASWCDDCDSDLIPNVCELPPYDPDGDCNANLYPDNCDITRGSSEDCNASGVPDECELDNNDCNANSIPDECEITPIDPAGDCNGNGVPDDCDTALGTSNDCNANSIPDECEGDCNGNGVPDDCDLTAGTSRDCNGNGIPNECDGTSTMPDQPVFWSDGTTRSRYLSMLGGNPSASTEIIVRLVDLPGPYAIWNGTQMWVGPPTEISELSGVVDPNGPGVPPGTPRMTIARLQCTQHCEPNWAQWGDVQVIHEGLVPGGVYEVYTLHCGCTICDWCPCETCEFEPNVGQTAVFGDCCGPFTGGEWGPADGRVDIPSDVVAAIEKFANRPTAPRKARVDVDPAEVDLKISIYDVTRILDGFRGQAHPFSPSRPDPCLPGGS